MQDNKKKKIVWIIRFIIAAIFIFSAYAKFCPWPCKGVYIFESKYLADIGIEGYSAKIFSKVLIGVELAIGILLLLPYYTKRFVIPFTIFLLSSFSIHLLVKIINGDVGNCGCFGECFSMTPWQALFKNIISIILLYMALRWSEFIEEKENMNPIITTFLACILLIFILMQRCCGTGGEVKISTKYENKASSVYNEYFPGFEKSNRLLLFLDPGCPECELTLSRLISLKKRYPGIIPQINIVFGGSEYDSTIDSINKFFDRVGREFESQVVNSDTFEKLFWHGPHTTPGVKYFCNGEERLFFYGQGENALDEDKLLNEIKREF